MQSKVITMFVILLILNIVLARNKLTKIQKDLIKLRATETTPIKFITLLIMRLIYGVASTMGLSESLAGVMNGAFVPPGADDDYGDYGGGGFGLFGNDDDGDDYDY